ncbi:MAG: hypothetical protein R2941_06315 [Desulfobacterales bacterium]
MAVATTQGPLYYRGKIETCSPIDLCYTIIEEIEKSIIQSRIPSKTGNISFSAKISLIENDITPYLKIFSGETDSYWKDIEPKGKISDSA